MTVTTTRRFFLGAMTAAAATRVWGANDIINVGIVGLGGRGSNHLKIYSKMSDVRVAGLCDVDQAALEKAQATLLKNTGNKAKEFADMRALFADPAIEAVSIATPNHWHALSAIWAMQAGKDVYGEKPACYNIYEGQRMIQVAARQDASCRWDLSTAARPSKCAPWRRCRADHWRNLSVQGALL